MLNTLNRSKTKVNLLIIFSFIIFSLLNIILLLHFKHIYLIYGEDMQFHWNRVESLIKDGAFTKYALSSFSNNGSAVMRLYPSLALYPLELIFNITRSVSLSTILIYAINMFSLLNICYFSSLRFSKSKYISYIFALLYSISSYLFMYNIQIYDTGMIYSYIFMPLVLFGFIYWINENKWLMLSIGATLIIYSNVIIAATIPFLLVIYIIISYKQLNIFKVLTLIKATIVALFTSSLFWLPALKLYLHNQLRLPYWNAILPISKHFLQLPLPSFLDGTLTIYSLLGFIVGIFFLKHMSLQLKKLYITSACILVLCSEIIPWNSLFNHTFIRNIQYTGRLILIPQVIFVYILSKYINYLLNKILTKKQLLTLGILIILVISGQLIFQDISIKETASGQYPYTYATTSNTLLGRINNISSTDYYPQNSLKYKYNLINNNGIEKSTSEQKHIIHFKSTGQGTFKFYIPNNAKILQIPFLKYNNENYQIYLNKRHVALHSNNQIMILKNIKHGHYLLHIKCIKDKSIIISEVMTILGIIIYMLIFFKCYIATLI